MNHGCYSLTPSTQTCAKVASVLEQTTPTLYNECETEVAVFVCCGCSLKSNILSGVYVYVVFFQLMQKHDLWGCQCFAAFFSAPKAINFAARRDWHLHQDEACYCPVSGMASGWGDRESVGHLCRCFSGRGGVCDTNERSSKTSSFAGLYGKNSFTSIEKIVNVQFSNESLAGRGAF